MTELITASSICSAPLPVSDTDDIRYGCKSTWGTAQSTSECQRCPETEKNKCKCYPNYELKSMSSCNDTIQELRLKSDQFCAKEEDGYLIPCAAGCCGENGCPGQCCNADISDPQGKRPENRRLNEFVVADNVIDEYYIKVGKGYMPFNDLIAFCMLVILISIILSTLSSMMPKEIIFMKRKGGTNINTK